MQPGSVATGVVRSDLVRSLSTYFCLATATGPTNAPTERVFRLILAYYMYILLLILAYYMYTLLLILTLVLLNPW
jgi:hypothetical protein